MTKKLISLLCTGLMLCFALSGCGAKTVNLAKVDSEELQFKSPESGDTIATIKTSMGDIKAIIYHGVTPQAEDNFISLAQEGYYNGITFHRVVEDFIIQTGDPTGTGNGGNSKWDLPFSNEYSDNLHHYSGALCMANSGGESSNRSQFYIVTSLPSNITDEVVTAMADAGWRSEVIDAYKQAGGTPNLDYRYTVFGQVYEGLDVAFAINGVKTDDNDRPKEDVVIESIEISVIE